MSKSVTDLTKAIASRTRKDGQERPDDVRPRPRLAQRLAELAPLRELSEPQSLPPPLPEPSTQREYELSRLSDVSRFRSAGIRAPEPSRNAVVPFEEPAVPPPPLPEPAPPPLEPASEFQASPTSPVRKGEGLSLGGFITGLTAALAIGIGLYIYLI